MNATLKRGIERALSSTTIGRVTQFRIRGKRLILAYHGIIPAGESAAGEPSLFVRQHEFARQLDAISEIGEVVSLDALDERGSAGPRVAITFDDAYRGAVVEGVRELVARKLPATIFVAPGRLDDHLFWWDALARGGELDESVRAHALHRLGGSDERVRAWARKIRLPFSESVPRYARTATRKELEWALSQPGITAGSHTWSHPNLAALTPAEIGNEINQARDWLRNAFGNKAIDWIAYPYGLDSPTAHRIAAEGGYRGGLRISGGWHVAGDVPALARPRLNVPASLSAAGFRARLIGALTP
ncbi:MAG TPA: polysaccharide deacetylase family protein [Gemmatimonadaceae bacterium]|nr:polysaccharide deacetylase family protein [Gemmatimonadaceae bacterium]